MTELLWLFVAFFAGCLCGSLGGFLLAAILRANDEPDPPPNIIGPFESIEELRDWTRNRPDGR
jgi:hypothetical protein